MKTNFPATPHRQKLTPRRRAVAAGALALVGVLAGCSDRNLVEPAPTAPPPATRTHDAQPGLDWTPGTLNPAAYVAPEQLRILPGGLVGTPIWKSNNPEAVTGEGWLMTSGPNAAQRGGAASALSGPATLYLSHLNFMGQRTNQGQATTNRDLWIHLLASNPSPGTITITGQGTLPANNLWRFRQTDPSRKSAWYLMSQAWINNTLSAVNVSVPSARAVEIAKVRLPAQPSGQDVFTTEGRYEVNVAGGGAYFHAVATFDGNTSRAITFATAAAAQQAPGNQGSPLITVDDSGEAYGREAGIATHSAYYSGDVNVTLPAGGPHYLALCYNTNARKPVAPGSPVYYQEQSAPYVMRLQSSTRTWAGYGHKYNAKLNLRNPSAQPQTVRLSLGANPINAAGTAVVFDAPVQVQTSSGSVVRQVTLYNRQNPSYASSPQRQELSVWTIPGGGTLTANVICYVPGLGFGAGLQLVLESSGGETSAGVADGLYTLTPACGPGVRLDLPAGNTTPGTPLHTWTANGLNPQK